MPIDGVALPDECVKGLMSLLGAERLCALRPLPGPGGCSLDFAIFRGFPEGVGTAQEMVRTFEAWATPGSGGVDFHAPTALDARPNQVGRPLAELSPESRDRTREAMQQLGSGDYDMLGVAVCDGSTFLAWVAVLRRTAFSENERLEFQQIVPPLSDHLALAQRLRSADVLGAGFAAVLEVLAEPAFLLRSDGRLVGSNRAGGALRLTLLDLREQLSRALSGEAGEWSARPVGRAAQPEGYLVARRSHERQSRPLGKAARLWKLTRAELRVLARVAEGCSNKEIATNLGCSVRTVEAHVAAILRKAGCRSRAAVVLELGRIQGEA